MTAIDPHRTLGLAPGATRAEIKRAYRRLAKQYHPDSAGIAALPRFLAIQAAYETLLTSAERGTGRGAPWAQPSGTGRPSGGPPPPWQADPSRSRATRDAYRARPGRATGGPSESSAGGATGRAGGGPRGAGSTAGGRTSGPASGVGSGGASAAGVRGDPRQGRRPKATIGSTSYDGADTEPFTPPWDGATWYGADSGTYWTVNPKEYADPRKHGPEYIARSRCRGGAPAADWTAPPAEGAAGASESAAPGSESADSAAPASEPAEPAEPGPAGASAAAPGRPPPMTGEPFMAGGRPLADRERPTMAARGTLPPGPPPAPGAPPLASRGPDRGHEGRARRPIRGRASPFPDASSVGSTGTGRAKQAWPGDGRPTSASGATPAGATSGHGAWEPIPPWTRRAAESMAGRLGLAVFGWFPVALAIVAATEALPACDGVMTTLCADPLTGGAWLIHFVAIAALAAAPRLAWIAAIGSASFFVAGFLATPVLLAAGGANSPEGTAAVLRLVVVVAWLAGVALALSGRIELPAWRRPSVR